MAGLEAAIATLAARLQAGTVGHREVAGLKLRVAPAVEKGLSESLQLLGGAGYIDDFPVERALRDTRLARIGAGTDDIMRELVAETSVSEEAYEQWMATKLGDRP